MANFQLLAEAGIFLLKLLAQQTDALVASRVYLNLENTDSVLAAINTATNRVIDKVKISQALMALVYVPNAVPADAPVPILSAAS